MSRENLTVAIHSLLAVGIMVWTFQWMDRQHALPSHVALQSAEQSVNDYCAKAGLHPYEMQLMDESAPDAKNPNWRFQFQSDRHHRITVEVGESGSAHIVSGLAG